MTSFLVFLALVYFFLVMDLVVTGLWGGSSCFSTFGSCGLLVYSSISFCVSLLMHTAKGYIFTFGLFWGISLTSGLSIEDSCLISASTHSKMCEMLRSSYSSACDYNRHYKKVVQNMHRYMDLSDK